MKVLLKSVSILLAAFFAVSAAACKTPAETVLSNAAVEHETKFGGVYIKITIADFNEMGFAFGDSVDIKFSSGFTLEDIPYYNGFYVDMGEPLLVGYPGYPYIRAGYNNGEDMFVKGELSETDTATVTLSQKAKYLAEQNAMDIHYSDEQGDLSDETFANFRAVNVGNLKENVLYRSASPCDNQHKRAAIADRLIASAGVNFIINLSDDEEDLISHINGSDFNSPYFLSLYQSGKVIPLSMSMAYKTDVFSEKLRNGLTAAANAEGPYLVHCVEGKDRTGFVCMVIEALSGATYTEIIDDYMITYDNYYNVNKSDEPEKYDILKRKNIDVMLKYITGDNGVDIINADYAYYAEEYLLSIGMSSSDVDLLKTRFIRSE